MEVLVHFATNRQLVRDGAAGGVGAGRLRFGEERGPLRQGRLTVSIPPNHRPGKLESPSILRLERRPSADRHVVILDVDITDTESFQDSLAETLRAAPGQQLMIYVHGFNNSFDEAARRVAQVAFDVHAEGVDLVPLFFSWPSGDSISPLEYNTAWTNADWAKTDLADFLLATRERHPDARIVLVAHSMGTNLLSRALERIDGQRCDAADPLFDEVILAAPDIDAGTFRRAMAPALRRLARRTTIYTARQDLALRVSEQVHGGFARLGDSSGQITVVDAMDTVDVSDINLSDIGHGYYAGVRAVLRDIGGVLTGLPGAARGLLQQLDPARRVYWVLPRAQAGE